MAEAKATRDRPLGAVLASALLICAGPLAAQSTDRAALERVAGCYAIEPAAEAPWLGELESEVRLTLEPIPTTPGVSDPGGTSQFVVRPVAAARRAPARYTYLAWSLFGDGEIVSIVWSSEQAQVALHFEPDPSRPNVVSIGTTTYFEHEKMSTSDPVDVRVHAMLC